LLSRLVWRGGNKNHPRHFYEFGAALRIGARRGGGLPLYVSPCGLGGPVAQGGGGGGSPNKNPSGRVSGEKRWGQGGNKKGPRKNDRSQGEHWESTDFFTRPPGEPRGRNTRIFCHRAGTSVSFLRGWRKGNMGGRGGTGSPHGPQPQGRAPGRNGYVIWAEHSHFRGC